MSSTLIPSQDLVPSVSSRVVTIDATSMLEATPDGEHWVDFILPQDLHVAADDKIIMAGSERVTLNAGKGSIRLPTYDPDAKTVDGSSDWVILVKKSWVGKGCNHGRGCGCGGAYAIRVPVGTSSISLADLPAVRALTPREQQYAITGVSVNVTTGSPASGSGSVSNGVLNLDLRIPQIDGNGPIAVLENVDLNAMMESGEWRTGPTRGITNYPPEVGNNLAVFRSYYLNGSASIQEYDDPYGPRYRRRFNGTVWHPWVAENPYDGTLLDTGTDLDLLTEYRAYRITASRPVVNGPPEWEGQSYSLEFLRLGTGWNLQRATDQTGAMKIRSGVGSSGRNWSAWRNISGGGGGGGSAAAGAEARTAMEVTGEWTTFEQEGAYLDLLGQHQAVTIINLGTSVEGRPVRGIQIGNKVGWRGTPNPTILLMATQHGDEMGAREGALIYARELAQAQTLALFEVCVVIVPTVNPDRVDVSRTNANGVNINRDWAAAARGEPETQAILNVFADYPVVAAVDAHGFGYPQQVSIRETRNPSASTAITAQSQRLYDAVFSMYEDEGQPVRMYGEPGAPTTEGTFVHEVSAVDRVAPLLIEIPSHRNTYGRYSPTPYWQAHVTVLAFREVVEVVYREREAFVAAKEGA